MRKIYKLNILLIFIILSTNLMATDYMVSGAGTLAVNGTYLPDGTNMFGAARWKLSGGSYYLHSDGSNQWVINDVGNFPFSGYYRNMTQSPFDANIPPFTGWMQDMGSSPAPTVGEAGPSLSYSSGTFTESTADDGCIENSLPVIITHNNFGGGTFTGTNGDNFVTDNKVIVTNLPTGLTALIIQTSPTTLSVTVTGTAPAHTNANDISNLGFAFQNSAFSNNDASAINNATKSDLKVNFLQNYNIASSGGDFATIEAAIAAASSGDIINISGETFTENELVVDKDLTIIGQGAANTIIQAATTYNTATHRVFSINTGVAAYIKNVTIRYGNFTTQLDGAGININYLGSLKLENADVSYNVCGYAGLGGGLYNGGSLEIINCAIHHNRSSGGGGVFVYNGTTTTITNSTITANSADSYPTSPYYNYGGGVYLQGPLTLSNSTITNNTCVNGESFGPSSGLCNNYGGLTISNSIITNNETSDYKVQYGSGQITDNGYNIVKYQDITNTGYLLTATTNILYNFKANQTASTLWNTNNVALANQNLNISSTLADNGTLNGTQTLAIAVGSFAIGAGINNPGITTDQRGLTRNNPPTIGAFEYGGIVPATISSFTPNTAYTGATVTITGTNFTGTTAVSFGGTAVASFIVNNSTTISAVVASGSSGSVSVTSPSGTASLAGFTYVVLASQPTAQATAIYFSNTVSGSDYNIVVNYTASASATNYLVVRKTGGEPTFVPSDATSYSIGAQGGDQIVYVGLETSATDAVVTSGTSYYYKVYAFNGSSNTCNYFTSDPLSGSTTAYSGTSGSVSSNSDPVSAGFPGQGVTVTFPDGTGGTDLTATKTTGAPTSNLSILPGVRGVSSLYFSIISSNQSPGNYILILDFSSLNLSPTTKWNNFKILKREDSTAPWADVVSIGGTIENRQTDGVWGKFTISGLSSFSEFAGGEEADYLTVISANETGAGTLKQAIVDATAGDFINFNTTAMGGNTITLASPVVIDKDLTILGADGGIVLDGNLTTKVLEVAASTVVRLDKMIITRGDDVNNIVGGISNSGDLTLVNCQVIDNYDIGSAGGYGAIGGIFSDGNLTLLNTTVAGNIGAGTDDGIGGLYSSAGDVYLYNSIFFGNVGVYKSMAFTTITESYNCLYEEALSILTIDNSVFFIQATPENDNLFNTDPKFQGSTVNPAYPYAILGASPCADAGANSYSFETTDIRGFDRNLNKTTGATAGTIDMGAFEYKLNTDLNNVLIWVGTTSTAWGTASNWDGVAVPTASDDAIIPSVGITNFPHIASATSADCHQLSVENSATLTIESGGSLITVGAISNNGTIDIKKDISQGQWHLISSPNNVSTANTFLGDYLQTWNETTAIWSDIYLTSSPLSPVKGYSLWADGAATSSYTFTGTPNTGEQSQAITYTNQGGTTFDGANLLGNPYPSSIDWGGLDDTYGAVYLWNGSAYDSWINDAGSGTQYIPSMQGFFIAATSAGTFNLTNADRTHNGAANFYKSSTTIKNGLVLKASNGSYDDELHILFNDESDEAFEMQSDAYKMLSNTVGLSQLYSFADDKMLSIDVRPACEAIQLGFQNSQNGNYSIDLKEMDGITSAVLEDTKLNTMHNFAEGAYHFDYLLSDNEKRFVLHLSTVGIPTPLAGNAISIYSNEQSIVIRSEKQIDNSLLTVTDLTGRVITSKALTGSNFYAVPVNLGTGIYMVSIQTGNSIYSEKVFVK